MRYVLIFALVIAVAKIDTLFDLYRKASSQVSKQKKKMDEPASTTTIKAENDTVSYDKDPSLKVNPHDRVIALMESFKLNPEPEVRAKIMEDIKVVPKLLMPTLDLALETVIYSWRDLIQENHPETINFMMDLENLLTGENLDVIRRNFVFLLDRNAEAFVTRYSKSRDVSCKAGALFGEPVPEEEKINEFRVRETSLQTVLLKETLDPAVKTFTAICLNVVKTQILTIQAASPQSGTQFVPGENQLVPPPAPSVQGIPSAGPAAPVVSPAPAPTSGTVPPATPGTNFIPVNSPPTSP